MNKKLLAGLSLTFALSGSLFAFTACGDGHKHTYGSNNVCTDCGDEWHYTRGFTYELIPETDTYELTSIGEANLENITIPYYYEGKLVTGIGDYVFDRFNRDSELKRITLPDSITSIGVRAFLNCNKLESINIPNGVTHFGSYAFSGCSKLTDINYDGTKNEWQAIQKGNNWNAETEYYTVHCTDGDI